MTRNKAAKIEARERAAVTGKYTAARRETRHDGESLVAAGTAGGTAEAARQQDHRHASAKAFDGADAAFGQLVGMQNVKNAVADSWRIMQTCKELKKRNLAVPSRFGNMVFVGPPGTGKSTVAKIVAELHGRSDVVELTHMDLKLGHVESMVGSARGAVLVIDNAHLLMRADADRGSVSLHPMKELLSAMDMLREDLFVIITGPASEMDASLRAHNDVWARFSTKIQFDRYSPDELADIAELAAEQRGQILAPEAKKAMIGAISQAVAATGIELLDTLGNARLAGDLIKRAEVQKLRRLSMSDVAAMSDDALRTVTTEDVREAISELLSPLR